jgi:hypothetical protein
MLKYEGFRNLLTTIIAFVTNSQSHTICPSNTMLISSFSLDLVQYANIGTSINNSLANKYLIFVSSPKPRHFGMFNSLELISIF